MDQPRNTHFAPPEPLRQELALRLQDSTVKGPIAFLNPTQARFSRVPTDQATSLPAAQAESVLPDKIQYQYTARNNRKGRHALIVSPTDPDDGQQVSTPLPTNRPSKVVRGIWRMFTYFPYWDVSWLVAVVFTLGSAVWIVNSFFIFLPLTVPKNNFPGEVLYGGGITAFIGATIFEIGSALLMLEAVNENRAGCFGWAIEQLYEEHHAHDDAESSAITKVEPLGVACTHHHQNTGNLVGRPVEPAKQNTVANVADSTPDGPDSWVWWPSSRELHDKYLHDIGFWACSIQTAAATIFYISGITALPGILNNMSQPILDVFYWTPQVIGGFGFVLSGLLFMIETQRHWWLPAPSILGWHIGLWNCIGGIGFFLCPCFGYSPASWAQYQAALSTFWGSWAFLIGSVIQWYESLEKYPVEVRKLHQT